MSGDDAMSPGTAARIRDPVCAERAERVRRKYRRNAAWYDLAVARTTSRLREAAVERLALAEGMRVLDLGCGTGLSLPLLRAAVGAAGAVYGVALSRDMLAGCRSSSARTATSSASAHFDTSSCASSCS
jgi:ubiquinone/menaquinone biosynthesis C-methylase UbiE